jgi:hypothetical protein
LEKLIARNKITSQTTVSPIMPVISKDQDTPKTVSIGVSRCQSTEIADLVAKQMKSQKRQKLNQGIHFDYLGPSSDTRKVLLPCLFYCPGRSKYSLKYLDHKTEFPGLQSKKPDVDAQDMKSTDSLAIASKSISMKQLKLESSTPPLLYQEFEIIQYLVSTQTTKW